MSANSKSSDSAQDHKGTISLRDRLAAWWEGTELLDVPAGSVSAAASTGKSAGGTDAGPGAAEEEGPIRYEPPKQRWETSRLSLVQKVWGEEAEGVLTAAAQDH